MVTQHVLGGLLSELGLCGSKVMLKHLPQWEKEQAYAGLHRPALLSLVLDHS